MPPGGRLRAETHPIRRMGDMFPWAALIAAVDRSFAQRFPKPTTPGSVHRLDAGVVVRRSCRNTSRPVPDEHICGRVRSDLAVMYAGRIAQVQVDRSQAHFVLPEVLAQFRSRLDAPLMGPIDQELLRDSRTATAMEDGLVGLGAARRRRTPFPVSRAASA